MLNRIFAVKSSGSTVGREIIAGLVTFMTMAYIIVVNPGILSKGAGMDFNAVMLATCVAAAFGTFMMGIVARYPIALAPGMGLNAYFSFELCATAGVDWQVGLGVVFISGAVFTLLTLVRVRELIVNAIPRSLKYAIAAGIGFFIAFIGLQHAGIIVDSDSTLVTMVRLDKLKELPSPRELYETLVALAGVGLIAVMMAMKVRGAILWGILATGAIAVFAGLIPAPEAIVGLPQIETPAMFELDIAGVFQNLHLYLAPILILLFFDMFDTIGTLIGVSEQAGLVDKQGKLPRINRALLSDSVSTMVGAAAGTSTVTAYIESAAGVSAGGRTGLANMVTGLLFVAAIFFSPIISLLGSCDPVTAPALIMVGVLMMRSVGRISWDDITEAIPAFLTIILMPLTYSIAHGLAIGFISWPVVKVFGGKAREVHWLVYVLGAIFAMRYILL